MTSGSTLVRTSASSGRRQERAEFLRDGRCGEKGQSGGAGEDGAIGHGVVPCVGVSRHIGCRPARVKRRGAVRTTGGGPGISRDAQAGHGHFGASRDEGFLVSWRHKRAKDFFFSWIGTPPLQNRGRIPARNSSRRRAPSAAPGRDLSRGLIHREDDRVANVGGAARTRIGTVIVSPRAGSYRAVASSI